MGWLWNTTPNDARPPPPPADISPAPSPPEASQPQPPLPKSETRDEVADRELQSFLAELEADLRPSSTKYNRVSSTPPPSTSTSSSKSPFNFPSPFPSRTSSSTVPEPSEHALEVEERRRKAVEGLSLEDQLYPTDMSCREAFDSAFYCQSLGGQFNNLYRYGGIKDCSGHWNAFWFCMRMKSYSGSVREGMIRDHYKKRALKYKVGPSSEDVWEAREQRLGWGEAFAEEVEEVAGSDEEWNRRERERREKRVLGTRS